MNPATHAYTMTTSRVVIRRTKVNLALICATLIISGCQSGMSGSRYTEPTAHVIGSERLSPTNKPSNTQTNNAQSPGNTSTSWLSSIDTDFQKAKALIGDELSVDLSNIKLYVVDDNPINSEVKFETQRLVNQQFGNSDFAKHFLQQIMHPLGGTYAALYSSRLSSILISQSMLIRYEHSLEAYTPHSKRAALMALLIHELVHAADDKRFDIHNNRALNFRASFAQSATFEGHAQWVTRQVCIKHGCSRGLEHLEEFMFTTSPDAPENQQAQANISRNILEYSYVEGERFIAELAQRNNGKQLIEQALQTPPHDPIQILAPATYPDTERESRNQRLLQTAVELDHEFARAPWIGIETSPLKGVDLQDDPERRQAAIEGFTQLIQSMVSVQFYNQSVLEAYPIEVTVLQTQSPETAKLFANMLHSNTLQFGAQVNNEPLQINQPNAINSLAAKDLYIYRTAIDGDIHYRAAIVVAGDYVVQIAGNTEQQQPLDDYAIAIVDKLTDQLVDNNISKLMPQ